MIHTFTPSQRQYVQTLVLECQEIDRTLKGFLGFVRADAHISGHVTLSADGLGLEQTDQEGRIIVSPPTPPLVETLPPPEAEKKLNRYLWTRRQKEREELYRRKDAWLAAQTEDPGPGA